MALTAKELTSASPAMQRIHLTLSDVLIISLAIEA